LREVLAGESAGKDIDGFQFVSGELGDVAIAFYVGPVLLEDFDCEGVDLNLPPTLMTRSFKA